MKWTAIVPARAGSKGLPNKNILTLQDKPLYMHSVDVALEAGAERVIVTTDISQIITSRHEPSVEIHQRPAKLALDTTTMEEVILYTCSELHLSGTTVLLQPTSPLRRPTHIHKALEIFSNDKVDLVISVTNADNSILKWGFVDENIFQPIADTKYCFANRQQLPPVVRPNGAIYIFDAGTFCAKKGFPLGVIGALHMNEEESKDIDLIEDFEFCQKLLDFRKRG